MGRRTTLGPVAAGEAVDRDHPLNAGLAAWLYAPPGVGAAGRRWVDLCGASHGTLSGQTAAAPMWTATNRRESAAVLLNGTSQSVSLSGLPPLVGSTWEVVARLDAAGNYPVLVGGAGNFEILGDSNTRRLYFQAPAGSVATASSAATAMTLGVWYHVVGTVSPEAVATLYLNGVPVASASGSTSAAPTTLNVGCRSGGTLFWSGAVESFRVLRGAAPGKSVAAAYDQYLRRYPDTLRRVRPWSRGAGAGANPVGVTPAAAALALTAFAPVASAPRLATPGTAALTLARFAPLVSAPRAVTPGTAALTIAAFAPAVATPRTATPGAEPLALTGYAPAVGVPRTAVPAAAALALTAFAPVASAPRLATPGTRALVVTLYAAAVVAAAIDAAPPRVNLVSVASGRTGLASAASGRGSLASVVAARETLVSV